ncbi:MAG: thermonuclease family protein [Limnohabitans sp.]
MNRWLRCTLWLALALPTLAQAQALALEQAWVSWVMDGDTVLLVPETDRAPGGREPVKLRILGIDAPESCQPGGEPSREALMGLVMRRSVRVELHGHDSYGRQLGRLWLGPQDVGAEMVRTGWAWAHSYRAGRGPYAALQREAQQQRRGLFAAPETAMSPSVFRQFHGTCHEAPPPGQARVVRLPHTGQAGSR